jgi:hypothetical protein
MRCDCTAWYILSRAASTRDVVRWCGILAGMTENEVVGPKSEPVDAEHAVSDAPDPEALADELPLEHDDEELGGEA